MKRYYGKKFGHLTIIEYLYSNPNKTKKYLKCRCDCGIFCEKSWASIYNSNTASCGCMTISYNKLNAVNIGKPAHNRKPGNEAAKKELFKRYQKGALTRELSISITFNDFLTITSKDCEYCGDPPNKRFPVKLYKGNDHTRYYFYNGIDRVNPSIGYEIDNCVPCCENCNYAKSDLSRENFLLMIEKVYRHSIKKR
jgi:hypothetical protein